MSKLFDLSSHSREPSLTRSLSTSAKQASSAATISRSNIRPVITSPPWAKGEPDTPQDELTGNLFDGTRPSGSPTTNAAPTISDLSITYSNTLNGNHLWTFLFPHLKRDRQSNPLSSVDPHNKQHMDDGSSSHHPTRPILPRLLNSAKRSSRSEEPVTAISPASRSNRQMALRLQLPPEPPFTVSHIKSPGWNSTARTPNDLFAPQIDLENNADDGSRSKENHEDNVDRNRKPLRKRIRNYLLHNNSVPLVSRIINISFTTVALAFSIRIRSIEENAKLLGAIGSSPFLVIIFAPLSLVHVMIAIYFEYFGRPLGLWRTSAKLAYTLLEVLFICAWSAELALSFDNYFTSRLNCTPPSSTSWFSQLPPLPTLFGDNPTPEMLNIADRLCDYQRTLIAVVMVALIFYVTNLVISLFRIFEKVKVGQGWGSL